MENKLYPITYSRPVGEVLCAGMRIKNLDKYGVKIEKLSDIISENMRLLPQTLNELAQNKQETQKGVFVGNDVSVDKSVIFDTTKGNIVIEDNTEIHAYTILRGPLSIGKNCVINSFAEIGNASIGEHCKVGGELKRSVMDSYSNKAHQGSVIDTYIGQWVNIGGGTSTSNLKNTYGTIKMLGVDTGLQHLGVIIGDYSKTAVNTSIFCGKVIGISSHLYGMVTDDVPSFTSHVYASKLYELPVDVAIKIQKAMSARRNVAFTDSDEANFKKLFVDTAGEREAKNVSKEKLSFK